ncbi:BAG family molecular chaperone regulator 1-like protein [Drosera capensis]
MMMRLKTKLSSLSPKSSTAAAAAEVGGGEAGNVDWEMRPCGMLVQKRLDSDLNSVPSPTIRVRVKHGAVYHEISISSQATFGELKKKLQAATGLHHQDQKLFFKDKERDSKAYLDVVGVKDKSKIVLVEDSISQDKRFLEMRKNAKMEKAAKSISDISLEVDRLASQVSALDTVMSKGGKVVEKDVLNLIELLMNELIKLDAIVADGELKLQRKMQVRRVQKYVETLDLLKVKNCMATSNGGQVPNPNQQKHLNGHSSNGHYSNGHGSNVLSPSPIQLRKRSIGHSQLRLQQPQQQQEPRHSTSATVVTTQWETFDSTLPLIPVSSDPPLIPVSSLTASAPATTLAANTSNQRFSWDLL